MVRAKWKTPLTNSSMLRPRMLWKHLVTASVASGICRWAFGRLLTRLKISVAPLSMLVLVTLLTRLPFLWACLLMLVNMDILLRPRVMCRTTLRTSMAPFIFVLLNRLTPLFRMHGASRLTIPTFALNTRAPDLSRLKVGGPWRTG